MNSTAKKMQQLKTPPLSFRLSKWLQRKNIRGGYRLENVAKSMGWLDVKVSYTLPENITIIVPIALRSYDLIDIMNYESKSIDHIGNLTAAHNQPITYFDCGADIGLICSHLISRCPQIKEVFCFEPNKNSYSFLEENTNSHSIQAIALNSAVSDFTGKAILQKPDFDSSDHAAYIVPVINGNIDVVQIDDMEISNNKFIIIKIDVEGYELNVLRGAAKTILNAEHFIIIFEAHWQQVDRTGIDPTAVLSYVNSLKPFKTVIVENPDATIDLDKPFFDQFPNDIYNICIHSDSLN